MKPSIIIQNNPAEKIKSILKKAVDVERWAPKSENTYTFIDEEEREEMVMNIIKKLDNEGYEIRRKK